MKNIKGTHEQENLALTLPNANCAFISHCNLENDLAVLEGTALSANQEK
jgi:hypothetical protein